MRQLTLALIILFFISSCTTEDTPTPQNNDTPTVQSEGTYDVTVIDGLVYAEGLNHQTLNSSNATNKSLMLDIFLPDNDLANRPAIVFIHGGGFVGGSRKAGNIVNLCNYFASRGWVAFSIDYRLRDDLGTIPTEWIEYGQNNLEPSIIPVFQALYPAHRDAKAALRWVVANADTYKINTDYLTVGGGSAGAITAVTLGVTNQEDYTNELSLATDPTLSTTNRDQNYSIKTILDFWGSDIGVEALEEIYGHQRFDETDPPLFIVHGTNDATVPFIEAEKLRDAYIASGVDYVFYELEGRGHGPWNATVDGKRLEELAFDFVVEQQELIVE